MEEEEEEGEVMDEEEEVVEVWEVLEEDKLVIQEVTVHEELEEEEAVPPVEQMTVVTTVFLVQVLSLNPRTSTVIVVSRLSRGRFRRRGPTKEESSMFVPNRGRSSVRSSNGQISLLRPPGSITTININLQEIINKLVAIVDNLLPEELFRRRETIKEESSSVVPNPERNNVDISNGWMKWKVVLTMATTLSMIFHLKLEEGEVPEEEVEEVLREKQEEMEEEQEEERRNRESVASVMNQVTPG